MFRRLIMEYLEQRDLLAAVTIGPYAGGVTSNSAKVFVRSDVAATVQIEYATSADFSGAQLTSGVATSSTHDFTSISSLAGLQAETRYFYRVYLNGQLATAGGPPSFTTFAPAGAQRDITFAIAADTADGTLVPTLPAPVYAAIAAENPAFVLEIGDFDHRNPTTLTQMRNMHQQVLGAATAQGADLAREILPRFPFFHVYDDHDYGIDDGDKTWIQRSAALQAFQEYYGTAPLVNPSAGIWHSFADGQIDVFMLDVRSQRDPNAQTDGPTKSILDGDNITNGQKAWLKAGLLNSTATWKFLISPVAFNPTTKPHDSWGAFATERNEILDFIRDNHIPGVIVVSGDLHTGGAIDDGTNSGVPEISVPHTNLPLPPNQMASGIAGTWSEGWISGVGNPGYAVVRVQTNPEQVVLEARGADGALRKSQVIQLPTATDTLGPLVSGLSITPVNATAPPSISARVSDFDTGSHNIVAAEFFIDTLGAPGTGTALAAADGRFNGASEGISATINATAFAALSPGTHTVRVRGRDEFGNWGPAASTSFSKQSQSLAQTAYVSTPVNGTLRNSNGSNLAFTNADILKLVTQSNGTFQYTLAFDGSDVGLATASEDVDAFTFLPDGSLVLSTRGAYSVQTRYSGGVGSGAILTGGGENLLRFTPTSLGANTAGSWSVYLRGSDAGLSGAAENIDAVAVLPDGRIIVSTTGNVAVPGVSGQHHDLLAYSPLQKTWAMYVDTSDVAASSADDDIDGLFIEQTAAALPTIHMSLRGNVYAPPENAIKFVPTRLGADTAGSFAGTSFSGNRVGLTPFGLDGIYIGQAPPILTTASLALSNGAISSTSPVAIMQNLTSAQQASAASTAAPAGNPAAVGTVAAAPNAIGHVAPERSVPLSETQTALAAPSVRKPAKTSAIDAALLNWDESLLAYGHSAP